MGGADGSVLADGRVVCADRTASAERHARHGTRGRPAGGQRHRSCAEVRRSLDGRTARGLRDEEDASHNRFVRWAAKDVWVALFETLAQAGGPPSQVLIDSTAAKAYRCAAGGNVWPAPSASGL